MRYFIFRLFPAILMFASCQEFLAQLAVDNSTNAVSAVQDYLLGQGIQAFNITYTGNNDQIASFNCVNCNLGIPSGVVMSSGNANSAAGPNTSASITTMYGALSSDPDLDAISAVTIYDPCILEFDFIPTGDSLEFSFVFGSDEYPEYTNSIFNDAFGFFLSGPGIFGPYSNNAANIAIIPGTSIPVTINNLNNGGTGTGGPCEYCQYYVHNGNGGQAPYNSSNFYIQADGFTTVIQAFAQVQCGEVYHIKLAIADGGDSQYNSWVFLEAGSFSSNNLDLSFTQPGISPSQNAVYEGCDAGTITFTRPAGITGDLTFDIDITGTATNGVDYQTIPDQVFFPSGTNQVVIPLVGILDGTTEGQESIILNVQASVECAALTTLNLIIGELPALMVNAPDVVLGCNDAPEVGIGVSGGLGQYSISWSNGGTGAVIPVPATAGSYTYTVTDFCGVAPVTGTVDVSLVEYEPVLVETGQDQVVNCQDLVQIQPQVSGGDGVYVYEWTINGAPVSNLPALSWPATDNAIIHLEVTDGCGESAEDQLQISLVPVPVQVSLGPDQEVQCLEEVTLVPEVTGGIGNYSFSWTIDGSGAGSAQSLTVPPGDGAVVSISVLDECANTAQDEVVISVLAEDLEVSLPAELTVTCLEDIELVPAVEGGVGELSYGWTVNGAAAGSGASLTLQANSDLQVVVQVQDLCGGDGTATVNILVPPVPVVVDLGDDPLVECFSQVDLAPLVSGGVGSFSYQWTAGGSPSGTDPELGLEAQDGLVVAVTVQDECGNEGTDEVVISIVPYPIIIDAPAELEVNCNESFTVTPDVTGGNGELYYTWISGGEELGTEAAISLSSDSPLLLGFEVSDACGNAADVTISISIIPAPISLQLSPDQVICPGESVQVSVSASGGSGVLAYDWSNGGASPGTVVSPADDLVLTVEVSDACGNEASGEVAVDVLNPDAPLAAAQETVLCPDAFSGPLVTGGIPPYTFVYAADSLQWDPEQGFSGNLIGLSWVYAEDACDNQVNFPIEVKSCATVIPNIFSPNGDEANQYFTIVGIEGFPRSALTVFNRWGGVVFETSDYRNDWDGRDLSDGTYFYIFSRSDGQEFNGYLNLVR